MPFPFEVPFDAVEADLDTFAEAVFGALRSEFLTMPKGDGFVEYPVFEHGYETLKRTTSGFRSLTPDTAMEAHRPAHDARIHAVGMGGGHDTAGGDRSQDRRG